MTIHETADFRVTSCAATRDAWRARAASSTRSQIMSAIDPLSRSHLSSAGSIAGLMVRIIGTAALWVFATRGIEMHVPRGAFALAPIGGWGLVIAGAIGVPLLVRAARRIRALQ